MMREPLGAGARVALAITYVEMRVLVDVRKERAEESLAVIACIR